MKRFDESIDQPSDPDSNMAPNEDNLFNSPYFQLLYMREDFLKQYHANVDWGKYGSKQRVLVMDGLIKYMKKTVEFAREQDDFDITSLVLLDARDFVFNPNLLLTMPRALREELVLHSCEREDKLKEKVDKIIAKLEEEKSTCLAMFE